jgi:hypothetical protein
MGALQLVTSGQQVTAHAVYVGDRINTANFPGDALSAAPLAVQIGDAGIAVLFRYGVIVFIGLAAGDEPAFLEKVTPRITSRFSGKEEETATIRLVAEQDDQVSVGGSIDVRRCRWSGCSSSPTCWPRASCWPMTNARWPRSSRLSSRSRNSWPPVAELRGTVPAF